MKCIENNACTQVTNCFSAHERVIFFSRVALQFGKEAQNNTRVSTETVRDESTYIILFLTRHNVSINDDKNNDVYTSSPFLTRSVFVPLMTSQSIADDVTIPRQLWYDAITWIMISNSLDIDFIDGDIHGRLCKKKNDNLMTNTKCPLNDYTKLLDTAKLVSKCHCFFTNYSNHYQPFHVSCSFCTAFHVHSELFFLLSKYLIIAKISII